MDPVLLILNQDLGIIKNHLPTEIKDAQAGYCNEFGKRRIKVLSQEYYSPLLLLHHSIIAKAVDVTCAWLRSLLF